MTTRPRAQSPAYRVERSPIHGKGLFATRSIRKGSLIGTLEGKRTRRNGPHVLWIEDEDGNVTGLRGENDLRFVNWSAKPNAVFYGELLYALRAIRPGEEITSDYGGASAY